MNCISLCSLIPSHLRVHKLARSSPRFLSSRIVRHDHVNLTNSSVVHRKVTISIGLHHLLMDLIKEHFLIYNICHAIQVSYVFIRLLFVAYKPATRATLMVGLKGGSCHWCCTLPSHLEIAGALTDVYWRSERLVIHYWCFFNYKNSL
jgi:hypothetical protein